MASPDLTAKGLTESPSYLGREVVAWRGMSRCQILSLHLTRKTQVRQRKKQLAIRNPNMLLSHCPIISSLLQSKHQEVGIQNHCRLFKTLEAGSLQRQATSVRPVIYYSAYQSPYRLETLCLF